MARRRRDVAVLAAGGALFASSAVAARGEIASWERGVFDRVNTLPDHGRVLWPVMQLGSLAAVPVLAVATDRITGDRPLAVRVAVAGLSAYLAAKVVKRAIDRGRPGDVFDHAVLRERALGRGFPSGHAGEAFAMACVLAAPLDRAAWVPHALATVVALKRVYVGAHLPADVVGGAGLGLVIGSTVNLVAARPQEQA